MNTENSDEIFILDGGSLKSLPTRSMRDGLFGKSLEDALQTLLQNYPKVIPGKQIDPVSDDPPRFVLLRREMPVMGWSLDHLYVDQRGILTLVETKLAQNPQSRREVVGQIIEYAANAREMWASGRARQFATEFWSRQDKDIDDLLADEFGPEIDLDGFWEIVESNLRQGKIRLIIASDELRPEVRRMIEYLNNEMQNAEILGLELRCYGDDSEQLVLVPHLVGLTEAIRQQKGGRAGSTSRTSQQEFLDSFQGEIRQYFEVVLDKARQENLVIFWGQKGFSLRVTAPSGKLSSIFYGFPTGAHGRAYPFVWAIARYLGDEKYEDEIRQRFAKVEGTSKYGKYGYELPLTENNLPAAQQLVDIVWGIVDELKQNIL